MTDADFTCPTCGPIVNRRHRCEDNPAVTAASEAMARTRSNGLCGANGCDDCDCFDPEQKFTRMDAEVAVAAARPIIEAEHAVVIDTLRQQLANADAVHRQTIRDWANDRAVWEAEVRERIATEVEARTPPPVSGPTGLTYGPGGGWYAQGMRDAARIARGQT